MSTELPPVAPEVLAEAVENLTPRLRKKLDAATEGCAASAVLAADGTVTLRFGEDALVTLSPGPVGTITTADQATCSCLLAPRCLHRAAALGAAPLADTPPEPVATAEPAGAVEPAAPAGAAEPVASVASLEPMGTAEPAPVLTPAQLRAAGALWHVAAEALAAGVTAGGAVVQAELLRAAHTARLAGLPRAEAAALRVVRGLRAARERRAGQRLGDLTGAFRELLHTAGMLASGSADPALTGTTRRAYAPGGSLQVHGLCREPVLSATGYGGVVTHLLSPDGTPYSVSDVRPGGLARARGAGSASVALGGATLDHAGLARGGLRIVGATVSAEGRLGAGRGVRATPLPGTAWTEGPAAPLFARPAAEAVAELLAAPDAAESALLGCDVTVVGAAGEHLLVRETRPDAPLLRLLPAHPHPELAHTENLRRIASYPGLVLRVLGRPDLDRTATLRPLAVGPVPGAEHTLRLPEEWLGRADLGYDRLQGAHFPQGDAAPVPLPAAEGPDPLADSPLWRVRRLLETGVAGGRRAVAEAARGTESLAAASYGPLRRAGLTGAADLAAALAAEADRRPRNAFGRLADPSPDGYAWAWLAAATHLAAAERCLIAASWAATPNAAPVSGR
ncbi:SWIM zinc finger family protein [Streptomyces sp. NBC_01214]|uniref:SWIM zinc finger family protein n=1 Tax=Streptomyces sp. NBC_01214 TaxID=2903777 RepID=UPI0022544FBD|nr:SWIM zinc finger family protein [Streptomyces sp. NBC_01214]MCX4808247.1 SWIM zinc finger family protein [Streptomyces sp. NBC_01214]